MIQIENCDNTEFYNQKRAKTYEFLSNQKSRSLIAMVVVGLLDNFLLVRPPLPSNKYRSFPLAHLYDIARGRTHRAIYEKRIFVCLFSSHQQDYLKFMR